VLHSRGTDYNIAAQIVKKAFTNMRGADVTTEGLFDV